MRRRGRGTIMRRKREREREQESRRAQQYKVTGRPERICGLREMAGFCG